MKLILLCVSCLLVFILLGYLSGGLILNIFKVKNKSVIAAIAFGTGFNLLLFVITGAILSLLSVKLTTIGIIWSVLLLIIGILGFFKKVPLGKGMYGGNIFLPVLVFILLLLQVIFVIKFGYDEPRVIFKLYPATRAFDTGEYIIGAPFTMLWVFLAKVINMKPIAVIYSLGAALMIPLVYFIALAIAGQLIPDDKNARYFLLLCLEMFNFFGYQSDYLINYTLLFDWFSENFFVVYIVLPLILLLILMKPRKRVEAPVNKNDSVIESDYYLWEEEDMKNHKYINARTVAVALVVVVIAMAGCIYIMNNKINSLYNTTVNLQTQVNDNCTIHEFIPEESGAVEAYLLVQSDGSVVVFDGGNEDYVEGLYDFVTEYGKTVTSWYVNGNSQGDMAGVDYCKDKGLEVKKLYVLNVDEVE